MVLASMNYAQPQLFRSSQLLHHVDHPNVSLLLLIGGFICAFLLSYVGVFGLTLLNRKFPLIRKPEPGRQPDRVPRLGGVAIFLAFVVSALIFYLSNGDLQPKERTIFWLFVAASVVIVVVHAYDDVKPLKPLPKLLAQTVAVVIVMGPFFNDHFNGVLLFGFGNPFQSLSSGSATWFNASTVDIFIHSTQIQWLAIPAVLFTWFWMVGMMNTVNLIDGVDGLAGGVVFITAIFVMILSWLLNQYTIAVLSGIFAGAVLGFLLLNWNPARMLMGDSGSQFLGLGLAVLSIMGGAKIALALMVLGVPIMDVAVVMINRMRHGQHPFHYDRTHLHYRLQATGLSVKQICYVFYALTILFGLLALRFGHFFKLIGIVLVIVTMVLLITWIDSRQRRHGTPMKLDGGDPTIPDDNGSAKPLPTTLDSPPTDAAAITPQSADDEKMPERSKIGFRSGQE